MQVVLNHYALAFAPGWAVPLGFVADGGSAVLLFFLMSGLVLTYSFERTPNAIAGGMARRFVRLGLPLAAAVLFAFVLQNTFPGWTAPAAQKAGSAWLASTRVSADWLPAIADLSGMTMLTGYSVTTLFGVLVSRVPDILTSSDNPIWSLHIEFWGSALVLGLVWARAHSNRVYIPRSHDNPVFFWIDDPEVIRDLIAINAPVPGHVVAQEIQHGDAEVLEGAVALVVSGMPVHQPP